MKRICKSHRLITSQTTGVKWWWKETESFFFSFFESHEKAPVIRMLSSADQKSLLASRGKRALVKNVTLPHVGPKLKSQSPVPGGRVEISGRKSPTSAALAKVENTNTGQEFDIAWIIIQMRGLQTELVAFQPACWCHGCIPASHPGPGINPSTP